MFYPPCLNRCPACGKQLTRPSRHAVTYFSLRHGARDAYATSWGCTSDGCKIRYHYNYFVRGKSRIYYSSRVPEVQQVELKSFWDTDLIQMFTTCMAFAWVSGANCGHIFNNSLGKVNSSDAPITTGSRALRAEQVWDAVYLNALLRDHAKRGTFLELSNDGEHPDRLKTAMQARNRRIIDDGLPHKMHACRTCEKMFETDDGSKSECVKLL